jgi:hypothetical protein
LQNPIFAGILFLIYGITFPEKQMNLMLRTVLNLMPYLTSEEEFKSESNQKKIKEEVKILGKVFNAIKHEKIMKNDVFSPSYNVMKKELDQISESFRSKNKSYAFDKLRLISIQCIDCHSRLPRNFSSSFDFNAWKLREEDFKNVYDYGIANLILRNYFNAREAFVQDINARLKNNEMENLEKSFKQILLIDLRVEKNPEKLMSFLKKFLKDMRIQGTMRIYLNVWVDRLNLWYLNHPYVSEIKNDTELTAFGEKYLDFKKLNDIKAGREIDLLILDGILSRYLVAAPESDKVALINFWLGKIGTMLDEEGFFKSGTSFLKQCIQRYPNNVIAKECFAEYEKWIKKKSYENNPEEEELENLKKYLKIPR